MEYIEVNFHLTPKAPFTDILIARLAELGFDTFEEHSTGFNAYVPVAEYDPQAVQMLVEEMRSEVESVDFTDKIIPHQNWNEVWESNFKPVYVKNCCIRAPFHEKPASTSIDIIIEPKMSFGTGHHETTSLMVEALLETDVKGADVLDMGSGTGILAILAAKLGAKDITGVDIDEWAYLNSIENAQRNGVPQIEFIQGGAERLGHKDFNLILANINRNIILRDLLHYHAVLRKNGTLLLSGFLAADVEMITEAIIPLKYIPILNKSLNHWTLLGFRKE